MPTFCLCLPIITSLVMFTACHRPKEIKISGQTMGTTWSLRSAQATTSTREFIQSHLDQREAVLVRHDPHHCPIDRSQRQHRALEALGDRVRVKRRSRRMGTLARHRKPGESHEAGHHRQQRN